MNMNLVTTHELARRLLAGPDRVVTFQGHYVEGVLTEGEIPDVNRVAPEVFTAFGEDTRSDKPTRRDEWFALLATLPKLPTVEVY